MSEEPVLYELRDHVAMITLNRPERMNALSAEMLIRFCERLDDAKDDPEVRVLILTGAGKGFCSGYDLKDEMEGNGLRSQGRKVPDGFSILDPPVKLHEIDKPTLCAINGPAAGYGIDLALGCDIRYMSSAAKFAPAFSKIGLVPESGGTWLLPRIIGWSKACEIVYSSEHIHAPRALEIGLVSKVIEPDELMEEVRSLASHIAANAPLSMREVKRAMRMGMEQTFTANVEHVLGVVQELFRTEDFAEGVTAFLQRRAPDFKGR